MFRFAGRVAALCLAAVILPGCDTGSGTTANWSGQVTVGGQPLPADAEGSISFQPTSADSGRGVTVPVENGRYVSPETPKGKVRVMFDLKRPTGRTYHSERTGTDVPVTESMVPPAKAAGIEIQVDGNRSDADFDL